MIKDTFESDVLSLKSLFEPNTRAPQITNFVIFLQFAPGVFSTHGQNIVFPQLIL